MTGGRGRGRPKGSKNKRAGEFAAFVGARYGGSAAQQMAALVLISPAELRAAGGSMAKAQVAKAADLVEHVRRVQEDRDAWLRQVIREELEHLARETPGADRPELRQLVKGFLDRVREASAGFGLREALDMLAKERAALLPYTDKRQPQAIEAKGVGMAPSVVVQVEGLALMPADAEFVEVFEPAPVQVAQSKSHGEGQGVELPGLLAPPPAD